MCLSVYVPLNDLLLLSVWSEFLPICFTWVFCHLIKLYLNKTEKKFMTQQERKFKKRQQSLLNGTGYDIYDSSPLPPVQIVLSLAGTFVGLVLCQMGCGSQLSR